MQINFSLFLVGLGIGLFIALVGGIVDYWLNLRPGVRDSQQHLPSCLLYVAGGLGLLGIIALIGSLIFREGITEALIVGAGVLLGFYAGFLLLFSLWFFLNRQ